MTKWFQSAQKFIVALLGVAGTILSAGLLHGSAEHYVTIGVTILTALSVYLVPNKP